MDGESCSKVMRARAAFRRVVFHFHGNPVAGDPPEARRLRTYLRDTVIRKVAKGAFRPMIAVIVGVMIRDGGQALSVMREDLERGWIFRRAERILRPLGRAVFADGRRGCFLGAHLAPER